MRKILLVIDMQKDFIDGALGTPEAVAIVDGVAEEIKKYPAADVFATRDTHPENYLETQEGRNLPVVHCVKGTAGWQLNEKVAAALGDAKIIDKPTFGSVELAKMLAAMAEKEALVKAFLPETPVKVIAGLCAGVTPASHAAALETMKMCQVEVL